MHRIAPLGLVALASLAVAALDRSARADEPAAATSDLQSAIDQFSAGPPPRPTLTGGTSFLDRAFDDAQAWKQENGLPFDVGALHWFRGNLESPHQFNYGTPTARGTLMYYVHVDPSTTLDLFGPRKAGIHAEYRLRDDGDRFRPYFTSNTWFWELYAWVDTDFGRLKAGQVWRRFGYDWDGSWHGTIQHFTGQKFDPDWGASLESEWKTSDRSKMNTWAQWFFAEDRVAGSYPGADPESDPKSKERRTFVARAATTTVLSECGALVVGISGQTQLVTTKGAGDERCDTFGADLNWIFGPLRVYGEISREKGVQSSAFLLSGGPTNERTESTVGVAYQAGPFTLRWFRSLGRYQEPDAKSVMYLSGVTIAIAKNVDLYVDYVNWSDRIDGAGPAFKVEHELDFVLMWRF